ncbi:MAG TPA: FixH family protein, partial [Burkholderiales bacterium]|nr:FixH family protein [Burkholderiales bacterium]
MAWACVPELPGSKGGKAHTIDSKKYALAYRTQPEKIEIGKHFVVEFALCAKDGTAAPESVRVDAYMPEHRHGMNYKTTVTGGAGKYRAEGLMFHMPGRWEYIFEVRATGTAGAIERLT